jgi:hypothetical protein
MPASKFSRAEHEEYEHIMNRIDNYIPGQYVEAAAIKLKKKGIDRTPEEIHRARNRRLKDPYIARVLEEISNTPDGSKYGLSL